MLRIVPLTSATRAIDYFREALSRGEYYRHEQVLDQEVVGLWGGRAAERLGIGGTVDAEAYTRLCRNLHPETGERLTPRTKDQRRVGWDCNFHVPKSVSVMLEVGGDRRILEAFRSAVRETMTELERDIETRVRTNGADTTRVSGNIAWAEFVHHTARPIDGVPDPHLHAHCVVFNATYDEAEQRWKAADIGPVMTDAPYFQAAYRARLKCRLVELGYEIERRGNGWEIAGVPKEVSKAFSRRTDLIEQEAAKRGIADPEAKSELGARTREAKIEVESMEELRDEWQSRLTADQRDSIRRTRETADLEQRSPSINPAEDLTRSFSSAVEHVFERRSTAPDRMVLAEALHRSEGGVTPEAMRVFVESQVTAGTLLRGQWEGASLLTTREVHQEEQSMLAIVREGRGACDPFKPGHEVRDQQLSGEQRTAVRRVLEGTDSVAIIRGRAGVGKTRLMREVVSAITSTGTAVQPVAPTAHATHEVLRNDGFKNAQTLAHLLGNPELRSRLKGQVVWLDEAGLASVPDMHRLLKFARDAGARVILTGDTAQHNAVQRGDALKIIEEFAGVTPADVTTVRRQATANYREACETLARGELMEGFGKLEAMGSIRSVSDGERPRLLAEEYIASIERDQSALVISPTHAEGGKVTGAIRERLRREGVLRGRDREVDQLTTRHLSVSQKADPAMYRVGDIIEFHQNAKGGFRKGDRAEVVNLARGSVEVKRERDVRMTDLPRNVPGRFSVFEKQTLSIATGDRVRITQNGRTLDGRHALYNGSIYDVRGRTIDGDLKLANGWIVGRDFGHLAHGYCVTSNAAQGRGVRHVIIAQSSESAGAASLQQFYTSVTRGKHRCTIFTDDTGKLLRAVTKDASRASTTQLFSQSVTAPGQIGLGHRRQIGTWLQVRHAQLLGRRGRERASRQVVPVPVRSGSRAMDRGRGRDRSRGRDRGREL